MAARTAAPQARATQTGSSPCATGRASNSPRGRGEALLSPAAGRIVIDPQCVVGQQAGECPAARELGQRCGIDHKLKTVARSLMKIPMRGLNIGRIVSRQPSAKI